MQLLIMRAFVVLMALAMAHPALAACGGTLTAQNNLAGLCDKATARTNLGTNDAGNLTTGTVAAARLPAAATARGFTLPFSGVPTTADADIYQMPSGASAAIAASTVPSAICRVDPAATVTFVVEKWTGTSSASATTLCTGSLSTSCAVSSCSLPATTMAGTNGISIKVSAASADSAARFTLTVPWVWQ